MLTKKQTNFILENLKRMSAKTKYLKPPYRELHYTRSKLSFFLRRSVSSFVFMLDTISFVKDIS